ncbi:hemerythrin domain-containing protein [Microtetraspora niveoalba]|uniref:hemerythrin domain-containing protein n=1 Tax=Microtetraspora niveoalba TaxID=46175 RepID=UPI000831B4B7|nr:hemerythrin domain-containing protein [Microtetraspora niveoalba]
MGRRELLRVPAALAGGLALTACGPTTLRLVETHDAPPDPAPSGSAKPPASEAQVPVTPPEDLMREHGVLKRILLVYREGIRRIDRGEPVPARELNAGARIIRTFIEQYHEELEEKYVFPALTRAGKLTDTVSVLDLQHKRGRVLTARILKATGGSPAAASPGTRGRRDLVADMSAFIRMYEPHEAREDTVVFPAFRDVVPPARFTELGEIFEDEEHRRFGARGFEGVVDQVADIEKALGIYDLSQFTPRV